MTSAAVSVADLVDQETDCRDRLRAAESELTQRVAEREDAEAAHALGEVDPGAVGAARRAADELEAEVRGLRAAVRKLQERKKQAEADARLRDLDRLREVSAEIAAHEPTNIGRLVQAVDHVRQALDVIDADRVVVADIHAELRAADPRTAAAVDADLLASRQAVQDHFNATYRAVRSNAARLRRTVTDGHEFSHPQDYPLPQDLISSEEGRAVVVAPAGTVAVDALREVGRREQAALQQAEIRRDQALQEAHEAHRHAVAGAGLGHIPPSDREIRSALSPYSELLTRLLPDDTRRHLRFVREFIPGSVTHAVSRRTYGDPLEQANAQERLDRGRGVIDKLASDGG